MQVSVRVCFSSGFESAISTRSEPTRSLGNGVRLVKKSDGAVKIFDGKEARACMAQSGFVEFETYLALKGLEMKKVTPVAKPGLYLVPKAVPTGTFTNSKASRGTKGRKALMRGSCGW